ncbi:MAG: potassium channel family protein [Candidatus Omnitrophota bacterium]
MTDRKKVLILLTILGALIIIDVSGYIAIEGASFFDAFYMTIISITTVGYREVFPLSTQGRMFTIWVIITGLGTFFYIAGLLVENTLEVNLRHILGRRKKKMLAKMSEHVVVAGFGIMGEHVCRELFRKKVKFIIIDSNPARFAMAEELGYYVILGDATCEDILLTASLDKAQTFISLLSKDSDNIFTVMAVRELNSSVNIISRALDITNEKRLYKVGANRVVTPYELGSSRIVNTILRPNVVDFIDLMTFAPEMSLSIEELPVKTNSPFANKSLRESGLREDFNFIVIATKRDGELVFNPKPDHRIIPGDVLIIVGEKEKILGLN